MIAENMDLKEIRKALGLELFLRRQQKGMSLFHMAHHKLYDGLASCLTKLSEFDQAIEVYQQIFQREEGKKKWDAQRSMKFVNKLKRKKAIGTLQSLVPPAETPAGETSSAAPAADGSSDASIL